MTTHPFHPMSAAGKLIAPAGDAGNLTTDTTYTKIFVGGLAWETQRDTMRRYFEQFGEILEAVVITDKNTGRSKGYGFVTFKEPESATRACENPSPVIDGRRANCNLAFLGASNRTRPPPPQFVGIARFRPPTSSCTMTASAYRGAAPLSDTYYHQPAHYALPYSVYGYSAGYSQETLYPVNYYGVGGQQQQFSPYYSQATPGFSPSYHPYRAQYSQSTPAHGGLSMHYPQMIQYPYLPQQFGSSAATLSLPTSINAAPTAGLNAGSSMASSSLQPPRNTSTSDQNKTST